MTALATSLSAGSSTPVMRPRARMAETLLSDIAAGDPAAVDAFLKRYSGTVWGLARRFCGSTEDAEDATQEIFVDVWRSAERYDPTVGSEITFLMTIARRRLIDRARRQGRRITPDLLAFYTAKAIYPTTKAEQLLGYRPRVSIAEGMRRAEQWLRQQGYLPPT